MKTYFHTEKIFLFICLLICISLNTVYGQANVKNDQLKVAASSRNELIVNVASFGMQSGSRQNATPAINAILAKYKNDSTGLTIMFPSGRYDFWPQHSTEKVYYESNTTGNIPKRCAIFLHGRKNVVLDGHGSSLIFHGRIQPFTVDSCRNITVKNLSIDWNIPLTAQGEVVAVARDYIDLKINIHEFPYVIEDGKIIFVGEGWKSAWGGVMEMVRETGVVAFQSGDHCLGNGWENYKAQEIKDDLVRLHYNFLRKPAKGNYLIMRHSSRDHAGIFILHSKQVCLKNIEVNHTAGLGVLAQYSEHLNFRNIRFVPNKLKNRYFSGHDDGFQVSNCKGSVLIDSCIFKGLMDDPINVHGTAVKVIEKKGPHQLICRFMHGQSRGFRWAVSGASIGFIEHQSMQFIGTSLVKEFKALNVDTFEITFSGEIPSSLKTGDALENLTWTSAVTVSHSLFGGSNRARGLLVSTPRKVLIEDNVFNSSGSAILIAGDANYWYESGAVRDVTIRRNLFEPGCLTSIYQFCEAVISIDPEIPGLKPGIPAFHRNINITDNTFHLFDYPVLYAKSVDGLVFKDNKLIRSYAFKPFHDRKAGITLDACYHVTIQGNKLEGDVLGTAIAHKNMPGVKIEISPGSGFRLE